MIDVKIVQMGWSHYYRITRVQAPIGKTLQKSISIEKLLSWAKENGYNVVSLPEHYKPKKHDETSQTISGTASQTAGTNKKRNPFGGYRNFARRTNER